MSYKISKPPVMPQDEPLRRTLEQFREYLYKTLQDLEFALNDIDRRIRDIKTKEDGK